MNSNIQQPQQQSQRINPFLNNQQSIPPSIPLRTAKSCFNIHQSNPFYDDLVNNTNTNNSNLTTPQSNKNSAGTVAQAIAHFQQQQQQQTLNIDRQMIKPPRPPPPVASRRLFLTTQQSLVQPSSQQQSPLQQLLLLQQQQQQQTDSNVNSNRSIETPNQPEQQQQQQQKSPNRLRIKELKEKLNLNLKLNRQKSRDDDKTKINKSTDNLNAESNDISPINHENITQNNEDEDDNLCKICMETPINCVLLECAHMIACINCAKPLKLCPICRRSITRIVRVYKS